MSVSLSLNRTNCVRAVVVVGLLLGSVYLLQHQPSWNSLSPELASPPLVDRPPEPTVTQHHTAGDDLWHPSIIPPDAHSDEINAWKDHNARTHRALLLCRATGSCSQHQEKVVILQQDDYRVAYFGGAPGGEKIYARSVLKTLDVLGVTYFFSLGPTHLSFFYNLYSDLIRAIIMGPEDVIDCWRGKTQHECLKTSINPHGVPVEHLFSPGFFGWSNDTPFGREWSLVPEDYGHGETYLGYSIEKECMKKEIKPHADKPRKVWIMAKHGRYFTDSDSPLHNETLVKAAAQLNIEFVAAFEHNEETDDPIPPGVTNLGKGHMLPQKEFEAAMIDTLAIVGIGKSIHSPTPWYGLCWSMPFLNPTYEHGSSAGYHSQHVGAEKVGEPHVYNFEAKNDDAFIAALAKAIEPHDRFIPETMTQPEMNRRTLAWLERDWAALVQERQQEEEYEELWGGKDYLL